MVYKEKADSKKKKTANNKPTPTLTEKLKSTEKVYQEKSQPDNRQTDNSHLPGKLKYPETPDKANEYQENVQPA